MTISTLFGDHRDLIAVHNMGQSCRYLISIARRSGRSTDALQGYIDIFRGASTSPTTNPVINPQR